MNWGDLVKTAADKLALAGVDAPRRDAEKLVVFITGRANFDRFEHPKGDEEDRFHALIARRAAREPLSHILCYRDFWQSRFYVNAHVLDPRPETETLVEAAIERLPRNAHILDLGTGSGAIALSIAVSRPDITAVLVDISKDALAVAKYNAKQFGVENRCSFYAGNWFDPVPAGEIFDAILSNPPYLDAADMDDLQAELRYEPEVALTPGDDGLAAYRHIAAHFSHFIKPQGIGLFEIGHTQGKAVADIFAAFDTRIIPDLGGQPRAVFVAPKP